MSKTLLAAMALLCTCVASLGESQEPADNRHIALEGQSNFRDLGGYKTRDGKTIKWGQVYRSGEIRAWAIM